LPLPQLRFSDAPLPFHRNEVVHGQYVNSGELDPPVPGDVDPTLVVIEEQYYKERFDSNQIYLS
jgi:hypothetical protein